MKLINARTPYFIEVEEADQVAAQVKLWIWNKGETEPTEPTYTIEKKIPSLTQPLITFNISPYIAEQIEPINPSVQEYVHEESNDCWVYVYAEFSYQLVDDKTWYLIRSIDYIGVNAFNNYLGGANQVITSNVILLANPDIIQYYNEDSPQTELPYFNILIDYDGTSDVDVKWINRRDESTSLQTILTLGDDAGVYMFKIPAKDAGITNHNFGNDVLVDFEGNTDVITFLPVCEPKYTPVVCTFINRYGGWQYINFWKAQTNNVEVKNSEFRLLPDFWDYNPLRNQTQQFNFSATQTVKLNTGWVDENYSDLMFDLMASETILLDNKPANIKTKSMPIKTGLMDKMINYEVEFTYSYNLINDVV